jgi:beta-lactamase superfamily II metal-dependent hydrolase
MELHIINVGCGAMLLLRFPTGENFLYDCNVTLDNSAYVLGYLARSIGYPATINRFVCSHRDADHIRGLKLIHEYFPIQQIADAGVAGTTILCTEYREYMTLRREIGALEVPPSTYEMVGNAKLRYLNSKHLFLDDANDQSIVMKIEFEGASVLIAGDTSYRSWQRYILPYYSHEDLHCDVLIASHHGSLSFFDDPSDERNYYVEHLRQLNPSVTVIPVGPNQHGLPNPAAVKLYENFSRGPLIGRDKVVRTDTHGSLRISLGAGWWFMWRN